jgi:hypothetical protein
MKRWAVRIPLLAIIVLCACILAGCGQPAIESDYVEETVTSTVNSRLSSLIDVSGVTVETVTVDKTEVSKNKDTGDWTAVATGSYEAGGSNREVGGTFTIEFVNVDGEWRVNDADVAATTVRATVGLTDSEAASLVAQYQADILSDAGLAASNGASAGELGVAQAGDFDGATQIQVVTIPVTSTSAIVADTDIEATFWFDGWGWKLDSAQRIDASGPLSVWEGTATLVVGNVSIGDHGICYAGNTNPLKVCIDTATWNESEGAYDVTGTVSYLYHNHNYFEQDADTVEGDEYRENVAFEGTYYDSISQLNFKLTTDDDSVYDSFSMKLYGSHPEDSKAEVTENIYVGKKDVLWMTDVTQTVIWVMDYDLERVQ